MTTRNFLEANRRGNAHQRLTILVVDDDPLQLDSIGRGLNLLGYQCLQALHGGQAMEILSGPVGQTIDVLLTDMTMPGKSGFELLQLARTIRPDLPAIVFAGLAVNPDITQVRRIGVPILQKPFDPTRLDQTIRQLLNDRKKE